jgi:hypothetical protein
MMLLVNIGVELMLTKSIIIGFSKLLLLAESLLALALLPMIFFRGGAKPTFCHLQINVQRR